MIKFSVCIPTYNRADLVLRAVKSVLSQDYENFEILVVDDGSTDNTGEVLATIKDSRLKYIRKENGGKHTAINCALDNASGEYFIILDSDDYFTTDCLHFINAKIKDDDAFVGVMAKCCDQNGNVLGECFENDGMEMTYIDFHFLKHKNYGDCVEALKFSILNQYRYPEGEGFKFVPERLIFDQIGLTYNLVCYNKTVKVVEYQPDGITHNAKGHLKNNAEGFLIEVCNKINVIMKKVSLPVKARFKIYVKYWVLYRIVNDKKYKCNTKSLLFLLARLGSVFYKL